MSRTVDLAKISFHRTRLKKQLETARPVDFFKMIWAADALITGRQENVNGRMTWPGSKEDFEFQGKNWFPRWELEHLLNEYLTVSPRNLKKKYLDCSQWGSFANCLNKYKALSNAESVKDHQPTEITEALSRLFIPQMKWQAGWRSHRVLNRYWQIYFFSESDEYFKSRAGVSMVDAIKVSFAAYSACQTHPAFTIDRDYSALGISDGATERVSEYFGKSPSKMREFARSARKGTTISDFKRSPIREFPIIRCNENGNPIGFLPIPELLLARVSDGLYFDCVEDGNIRRLIGEAFEKYSLGLLNHFLSANHIVHGEIKYNDRMSPDALILSRSRKQLQLVVECKARRIPVRVLQSAIPRRDYPEVYTDIIKGFVQIWRFVSDCRNGDVGFVQPSEASKPRGVLLTLDPWLVVGNQITKMVRDEANKLADRYGIRAKDRIPVTVTSAQDWEHCLSSFSFGRILEGIDSHCQEERFGYMLDSTIEEATGNEKDEISPFPWKAALDELVPWFQTFDR